jgi:DNA-nicking Smr family endonuclease
VNDQDYKPFAALKKAGLKLKDDEKKGVPKPAPQPKKPDPEVEKAKDDDLFLSAMTGTKPMNTTKRVPPKNTAPKPAEAKPKASAPEKPAPKKTAQPAPTPAAPVDPDAEADVFLSAMSGVKTLDGESGRAVPKKTKEPEAPKLSTEEALSRERVHKLLHDDIAFDMDYAEGYQYGQVQGLDPKIFNKLKAGSYDVEARLDLHGMTVDEACHTLLDFMRKQYQLGHRYLLLVTGRGKNSPMGRSIIREEMQYWLTRDPLRQVVLAFVSAQPRDGGPGALYVLLRKYKKSIGKINWEKLPGDWNDL